MHLFKAEFGAETEARAKNENETNTETETETKTKKQMDSPFSSASKSNETLLP